MALNKPYNQGMTQSTHRGATHGRAHDQSDWDDMLAQDDTLAHDDALYAEAARFGYGDDEHGPVAPARKQKQKPPQPSRADAGHALAGGDESLDERFVITYTPARFEAIWLMDSLRPLAERALIRDVLALVKGGKEANVYLCEAATETGGLVAAKVYRPRQFRNLRNDKMYREGREVLNSQGVTVKAQESNRVMRAINKKTDFGAEVMHTSWLMHEYITLERLHKAGAAVPEPLASGENTLLMRYVGNRQRPAPVLHSVALASHAEAQRLFQEVLRNVDLMLSMGMIHGDLSAYNLLYWEGDVTLIDFPQVTFAVANSNAYKILQRDIQRVCDYFASQGVEADAPAITRRLWAKHVGT